MTSALRKQIRAAFTSNETSFASLEPPTELLEHVEDFIANKNGVSNSTSNLREEPRIGDLLVELSIALPKTASQDASSSLLKGRLCAWLILLAKLCVSGSSDLRPSEIIHLHAVWYTLLKPALAPHDVVPTAIYAISRQGVQAAKELVIWGFGDDPDSETGKLSPFEETLLKEYIELYSHSGQPATIPETAHAVDKSKRNLQELMLAMGRLRPKNMFAYLAKAVPSSVAVRQSYLILISTFLKHSANLSHHTTTSKLLDQILICLLVEVDAGIIHLSLSCVLIAIPRIPTYLAAYIPPLFAAYSKLVAFQQQQEAEQISIRAKLQAATRDPFTEHSSAALKRPPLRSDLLWATPPTPPQALSLPDGPTYTARELFTYLYGIVPVNLTKFLEAPKAYLNKREWLSPFEEGLEEPLLRLDQVAANSNVFLQAHAFQPAIINLNANSELSSLKTKWAKLDAATVIDECERLHIMRLSIPSNALAESNSLSRGRVRYTNRSGDSRGTNSPDYTPRQMSLSRQSVRTASSNLANGIVSAKGEHIGYEAEAAATPAVNGYIAPSSPGVDEVVHSPGSIGNKSPFGLSMSMEDARNSASLANLTRALSYSHPSQQHATSLEATLTNKELNHKADKAAQLAAQREKELDLLRAELQHELYLKAQHHQQMGAMHRQRIAESAYDADRNSLYQAIKHLRRQLMERQSQLDRLREEMTANSNAQAQWENELRQQVQTMQTELLKWRTECESAKLKLEDTEAKLSNRNAELEELGVKVFELEAQATIDRPKIEKARDYDEWINRLTSSLLLWDQDVARFKEQSLENEMLISEWRKATDLCESAEREALKLRRQTEDNQLEIKVLTDRLATQQSARTNSNHPFPASLAQTSYEQLRDKYSKLQTKYLDLEARHGELQALPNGIQ